MTQLWYPGRPPFCAPALISLLTMFVDVLLALIAKEDISLLHALGRIQEDALEHIARENEECLGTDSVLNHVRQMLMDGVTIATVAFDRRDWNSIQELATTMTVVRDELREQHERVTS